MFRSRYSIARARIISNFPLIDFKLKDGKTTKIIYDHHIEEKYGVSFGQKIKTPRGNAIVLGEYNGNLCFTLIGQNGLSCSNSMKGIEITNEFANDIELNNTLFKLSNYKEILLKIEKEQKINLRVINRLTKFGQGNLEEQSAVSIQKVFRGNKIRKKFKINQFKQNKMSFYPTFVVGNDPVISNSINEYHETNDKIALVATSGIRAVEIACEIGNPQNTPKIILIDNSKEVIAFWHELREFIKDDEKAATSELFLNNLSSFLDSHKHLFRDKAEIFSSKNTAPGVLYPDQDINNYFESLIKKYGYDYVRSVIIHTSLIKQSWTDSDTFIKLKNILNYQQINKIYMYPSNIAACIHNKDDREQLLQNIEKMAPVLSIHTDCCPTHHHPEKVFILKNNNPTYVANTIFANTECVSKIGTQSVDPQKRHLLNTLTSSPYFNAC